MAPVGMLAARLIPLRVISEGDGRHTGLIGHEGDQRLRQLLGRPHEATLRAGAIGRPAPLAAEWVRQDHVRAETLTPSKHRLGRRPELDTTRMVIFSDL